jgi:predicted nucleic acid-binding protein
VIVTDTNLITYLTLANEQSELAGRVFERNPHWVAPLSWRSEFRNALSKYILHAGMKLEAALLALHSAEDLIAGREYRVSSERVLELVMQSKCSAYDCEFVALAVELGVPLVTTDKQVLRAFQKLAWSPENYLKQK